MKEFRVILYLISFTLFSDHLLRQLVECKALLCHPSPKWTVNNGSEPMRESLGNVTLVTLINASFKFGLKQASSLENMSKFLKKSGLKDINFIIINSKDFDSKRKLKELSLRVSFGVYQESDYELVWDVLDGGRDDMFIYDRCGLLTYYIPFPLSVIHAQQPILQAALLSTYFDNPCGESCDSLGTDSSSSTTTSPELFSANTTDISRSPDLNTTSASNVTFDGLVSEELNVTNDIELNVTSVYLKEDNVFTYERPQINDSSLISEDFSGSGSGEEPIEPLVESTTLSNEIEGTNKDKEEDNDNEWRILDFFKSNDNRSDKEVFDDIYDKSLTQLETNGTDGQKVVETTNKTQTTTESTDGMSSSTTTTAPSVESTTTSAKRTRFSFFNSGNRTKCETFNKTLCTEWSTDRLLRARLCCLSEVLVDDESGQGFGCGQGFERSKCHRMLPIIKCCLKDFSQLIENYFQSIPVTSRPSQQNNN